MSPWLVILLTALLSLLLTVIVAVLLWSAVKRLLSSVKDLNAELAPSLAQMQAGSDEINQRVAAVTEAASAIRTPAGQLPKS